MSFIHMSYLHTTYILCSAFKLKSQKFRDKSNLLGINFDFSLSRSKILNIQNSNIHRFIFLQLSFSGPFIFETKNIISEEILHLSISSLEEKYVPI